MHKHSSVTKDRVPPPPPTTTTQQQLPPTQQQPPHHHLLPMKGVTRRTKLVRTFQDDHPVSSGEVSLNKYEKMWILNSKLNNFMDSF